MCEYADVWFAIEIIRKFATSAYLQINFMTTFLIVIIALALIFDYINGFHDARQFNCHNSFH